MLAPLACPKSSFDPGYGDGLLPTTCEYIFCLLTWSNTIRCGSLPCTGFFFLALLLGNLEGGMPFFALCLPLPNIALGWPVLSVCTLLTFLGSNFATCHSTRM